MIITMRMNENRSIAHWELHIKTKTKFHNLREFDFQTDESHD
jgi:hypothetical protein